MDDAIHIEKTDQCYNCEYFCKGVSCPLLEALALGVVELVEEMTVQNCGFYKKFSRHLSVVPDAHEDDMDISFVAEGDEDDEESQQSCV